MSHDLALARLITMGKSLVVVGAGFAGVRAALAAAEVAARAGGEDRIEITVVSPEPVMGIRPRFYEAKLDGVLVPLDQLLPPAGIRFRQASVEELDPERRTLHLAGSEPGLRFDQLVLCAGSRLLLPDAPDCQVHAVDSFEQAKRLGRAISELKTDEAARFKVSVVGAGFSGLEVASELAGVLRQTARDVGRDPDSATVTLIERGDTVAPAFGPRARVIIDEALDELGVRCLTGQEVHSIRASGVKLADGREIEGDLTVWAGGPTASRLATQLAQTLDMWGRVDVDRGLATNVDGIWAAGDVARVRTDNEHHAVMSCQHAMPQGSQAGANAARALIGKAPAHYEQQLYLTCLDLGDWGALLTQGWERDHVLASGRDGKAFKHFMNRSVIYPPASGELKDLLRYARPQNIGRASAWAQRKALSVPLARRVITGTAKDAAQAFAHVPDGEAIERSRDHEQGSTQVQTRPPSPNENSTHGV